VAVLGSRPTPLPTVVAEDTQAALQALAAHVAARLRDGLTVAGVTGSRGKTSTKDLLAAVLSAAGPAVATIGSLNNELGVPLTMLRASASTRFLVLEMGARRIGDIAALTGLVAPDIAVVLNVGQAHLSHFGSRAAIARAKGELVQGLASGGTAVLNADDPRVAAMRALTDGPVLTFGHAEHADVRVLGLTLDRHARPSFTLRSANASLSKWRLELRDLAGGATLLNDSFNADPDSARAALDTLAAIEGECRIAVLGEMLELGDDSEAKHHAVGQYAASRADVVVAVGEAARPIADGAGQRAVALAGNDAAVGWLRGHLAAGDVVLVKASRGARLDEVAAALM
jgi:UDP-N-acetylmuramoyl-tripeptide--D-alanyl-D-alanine ligase